MSVTLVIILITVVVSVLAFSNQELFRRLVFNAYDIKHFKNTYRFLSYALIHGDWIHLLVNMMVLFSFGRIVEQYYGFYFGLKGILYYLLLYVGGTALSTLPSYGKHKDDYSYTAVGASGAVSAVLFTSIFFSPLEKILLYGILPMPGIVFGILYLAYSSYMGRKDKDHINHDAHLWGAIYGFLFPIFIDPSLINRFIYQLGF